MLIMHQASREQVEALFDTFAETRIEIHDQVEWSVPEWLATMWETARSDMKILPKPKLPPEVICRVCNHRHRALVCPICKTPTPHIAVMKGK